MEGELRVAKILVYQRGLGLHSRQYYFYTIEMKFERLAPS